MKREREIIKTSIIGILVNLILVAFKATVGLIVNSIAIVLDAINNLSDALSSIITIIGTKIASKAPDKEHPYGHGRIEYISAIVIAFLIFIAGITSFKESVSKILDSEPANYTTVSLIIVFVAVIVKLFLGNFVKNKGEKYNSTNLIASGTDALFDAIISFSTFVAAIISILFNISLEGYLGLVISILIIKSSYEILKDTLSEIIGERIDSSITKKVKEIVTSYDDVEGAYDLILHSYGTNNMIGSIHIQVDDNMKASEIHTLSKKIESKVFEKLGIILTVGIYANNSSDKNAKTAKEKLKKIIKEYKDILELHGFYMYDNKITFDLIISFEADDRNQIKEEVLNKMKELYPKYIIYCNIDSDYSDR